MLKKSKLGKSVEYRCRFVVNGTAGLPECEQFMLIISFRIDELAIVMNGQNDEARSLFRTSLYMFLRSSGGNLLMECLSKGCPCMRLEACASFSLFYSMIVRGDWMFECMASLYRYVIPSPLG